VSTQENIAKLQDLLARVQMRATAPRTGAGAAFVPAQALAAPPEPVTFATPVPEPITDLDSIPPVTRSDGGGGYGEEAELGMDAEVEISTETVEVDIDIDEPGLEAGAQESGAQPVAHATMPPEDLEEEPDTMNVRVSAPAPQELEEVTQTVALANEIEEPAPSSSRRPIAGEEPVAEAYEEESAPRHTPPPESGKQVAAPSVHPPSRKPSAPPPSLEGHTLIGGWREPGLGAPKVPQGMGGSPVRVPGPPPAQASGTRLSPDVTQPQLAGGEGVATFEGAAPVAKPATLGDLLDMTLGL
jgi:hypothetical protein